MLKKLKDKKVLGVNLIHGITWEGSGLSFVNAHKKWAQKRQITVIGCFGSKKIGYLKKLSRNKELSGKPKNLGGGDQYLDRILDVYLY